MRTDAPSLGVWSLVALGIAGAAGARADDAGALKRCAAITTATERLACFDQLAAQLPQSAAPAVPPAAEFGLTRSPRPKPELLPSIGARVTALGRSAAARPTVALDNGQLWELDAGDALLGVGDLVTIRRGSLTSFLLETPQRRTYHARRLR